MANVQQIIVDAAQRHNVPVEALLAIAKIESGFNPSAQNPNSSAGGVFQFTDATAREYGLTGDKRNDVAAQADAAARMVKSNSRALSSTLGRAPTAGELYLAHQQGLTGARALLANPDKTAAEALQGIYGGRAASVVRQNGGDPNARASQFASQWVNKGNQTAGLFPPGELPQVATRQDTRRPALPPVPVTPSPQISALRASSERVNYGQGPEGVGLMPTFQGVERFANGGSYGAKNYGIEPRTRSSAEINSTVTGLSRPRTSGNLGDSLAMNPVSGGPQQAPMFDGIYDERINAVRPSGGPINTQGMATMRSSAPAPVPASPYDRVTARLNNLPPQARLPAIPPPAVGGPPTTRSVQSVPMVAPRMQVSASDMARGRNGWETIASIPSTPAPTAFSASDMARGRSSVPPVIDRLGPSTPGLPALYGGFSPEQVAMIGVPAMPEIPGAPRTRMASAAPFPMPRPSFMPSVGTSLSVRPMPPMPIARPQIAQQRRAPVPMPLAMRPAQQRAPLRIVVQRDQPVQQQPKPTPQGFTDNGNGSLTSSEYGSTYYSRHL